VSIGPVFSLPKLTNGFVPGRISGDISFAALKDQEQDKYVWSGVGVGVKYEKLLSNLIGYYLGVDHIANAGSARDQQGTWLGAGATFELRRFGVQVGASTRSGSAIKLQTKIYFGLMQFRRTSFGLPASAAAK
jgi:hypothetical protein